MLPQFRSKAPASGGVPAGAYIHYKADNIDGTDNSSVSVEDRPSAWVNLGSLGSAADLGQATAGTRPTMKKDGNGVWYVDHHSNSSNKWMTVASNFTTITNWMVAAVVDQTGDTDANRMFYGSGNASGAEATAGFLFRGGNANTNGGNWSSMSGSTGLTLSSVAITVNQWEYYVAYRTATSGASNMSISGVETLGATTGEANTMRNFTTCWDQTQSRQGRHHIKEILVYSFDDVGDIRDELGAYFTARYGAFPQAEV